METWEAKLIVLFSMFSIAFISGVIPIKLVDVIRGKRRRSHQSSADSPGHGDVSPANVAGGATVRKVGDIEAAETTIPGGGGQTMLRNSTYSSLSSALSKDSAFGDQLTFGGVMTCSRTTADQVLAMLNCFAGGVFLATSLLHLLPDVRKDIEQVLDAFGRTSVEFPLAEFVTSVGFFVVMAIEQVVLHYQTRQRRMTKPRLLPVSPARQLMPASQLTSSLGIDKGTIANDEMERRPLLKLAPPSLVGAGNGKAACCAPSVVDGQLMLHDPVDGKSMNDRQRSGSYPRDVYGGGGRAYGSMGDCVGKHSDGGSSEDDTGVHSALQLTDNRETDAQYESKPIDHVADDPVQSTRSFVLLLALSIHTVFEGLALGLQDSTAGLWTLFAAVALHKVIMAFTSGLRFAETLSTRRRAVVYVLAFAATSPLGIGIGTAVSESGGGGLAANVASALLQGLATGTFIYVTFFEVLNEQLAHERQGQQHSHDGGHDGTGGGSSGGGGIAKVLAVAVGYAFITLLELFASV